MLITKIKNMDYQKKSNYFWTIVFVVIVCMIIFFTIKLVPDALEYIRNTHEVVSISDSSTDKEEEIFKNKVIGMDHLSNSLEIEKESEIFKFGFLVNSEAKDMIFVVKDPNGNTYNTWDNMKPDFVTIEPYSEGFYIMTVDWKQARMSVGKYDITVYGTDLNSFVAVQV